MTPVRYEFGEHRLFTDQGAVDAETLAEIEAQNLEAAKSEPVCVLCDDTGVIEHNRGWGESLPCRCSVGRSNAIV